MFKELILSTILSASFSFESSNDEMKPDDYDFLIKAENNTDNISEGDYIKIMDILKNIYDI